MNTITDNYNSLPKLDKNGNRIEPTQWVRPCGLHNDYNNPQRIIYVESEDAFEIHLIDGIIKEKLSDYRNGLTQYHSVEISNEPLYQKNTQTIHNLNDEIEFELTDVGVKFVESLNKYEYVKFPLKFKEKDTPYKMSLWEFVNIFGPTMGHGFDQTVKISFKLRKR